MLFWAADGEVANDDECFVCNSRGEAHVVSRNVTPCDCGLQPGLSLTTEDQLLSGGRDCSSADPLSQNLRPEFKKKKSILMDFFLSFEGGEWAYVPDKGENLILLPTNPLLLLFGARDAGALQVTSWRRAQTKSKQVVMEKVETTTVKTKRGHLEHQTLLSKTQLLFSIKLNEKIQKDFQKRWQHDHTNQTSISQNLLSWRFRPLSPFSQSWSQRLLLRAVSICVCRAFLGRMLVSDCSGTDGRSRRSACCWSCSRSFLPGQQENSMRACGQSHCKNGSWEGFQEKKSRISVL